MDANELEKVLLNKCIELYWEVLQEYSRPRDGDIDYGTPPRRMRISLFDAQRQTGHFYKRTLIKTWSYVDDKLLSEDIHKSEEEKTVSGMFYNIAEGHLYWDLSRGKAFIDMYYGKRYARGYIYDIVQTENGITLGNERVDWVS